MNTRRSHFPRRQAARRRRAFVLLEAMLAVVIFSLGVLALGRCVGNCLSAERLKQEDARAVRILANRMTEIEAGMVNLADSTTEKLKEMGEGMTLKTTRAAVKKKNARGQELTNLFMVTLALSWESDGETRTRELFFYVHPKRR
jgi:Tfp pilus assembly protein PilV